MSAVLGWFAAPLLSLKKNPSDHPFGRRLPSSGRQQPIQALA
jgi:hypothetical protein